LSALWRRCGQMQTVPNLSCTSTAWRSHAASGLRPRNLLRKVMHMMHI
jgi:hypothetical protein